MFTSNNSDQAMIESMDKFLGCPFAPEGLFTYKAFLALDESSCYPDKQVACLNQNAFHHYFVPAEHGGKLQSFQTMMLMYRLLYRRDPSLGLGYGLTTFMAAVHVWVAGNDRQKIKVAETVLSGQPLSIAYHEKNNGNDVLSSSTTLISSNYLKGEKWIVNNIKACAGITIFVNVDDKKTARSYSLYYLDKKALRHYKVGPKIKTMGVKACRIASIQFKNCIIKAPELIGANGSGLELTFKSFQITRTIYLVYQLLRLILF